MPFIRTCMYGCMSTSTPTHHAVDVGAVLVEQALHDGGVGPGGRQHQLAGVQGGALHRVRQLLRALGDWEI